MSILTSFYDFFLILESQIFEEEQAIYKISRKQTVGQFMARK